MCRDKSLMAIKTQALELSGPGLEYVCVFQPGVGVSVSRPGCPASAIQGRLITSTGPEISLETQWG